MSDDKTWSQLHVLPIEPAELPLVELMNRYEGPLYGFLVTLLGDRDAALDCEQETFLRAYQHLSKGKPLTAPWLYKVARNLALKELKQRGRAPLEPELLNALPAAEEGESTRTMAVRRALAKLSPSEREILYLSQVDNFKSAEIAEMLGIRPGAVRMRLSRAHKRFRDTYGDCQ